MTKLQTSITPGQEGTRRRREKKRILTKNNDIYYTRIVLNFVIHVD